MRGCAPLFLAVALLTQTAETRGVPWLAQAVARDIGSGISYFEDRDKKLGHDVVHRSLGDSQPSFKKRINSSFSTANFHIEFGPEARMLSYATPAPDAL